MGARGHAHPSLGMTTTKTLKVCFLVTCVTFQAPYKYIVASTYLTMLTELSLQSSLCTGVGHKILQAY